MSAINTIINNCDCARCENCENCTGCDYCNCCPYKTDDRFTCGCGLQSASVEMRNTEDGYIEMCHDCYNKYQAIKMAEYAEEVNQPPMTNDYDIEQKLSIRQFYDYCARFINSKRTISGKTVKMKLDKSEGKNDFSFRCEKFRMYGWCNINGLGQGAEYFEFSKIRNAITPTERTFLTLKGIDTPTSAYGQLRSTYIPDF